MAAITRKQFRDAVETLLDAQQAATPTLLRKTARFHPGSVSSEKPIAWQGEIASAIVYDQGTRGHTMTEDVQIATTFPADLPTDAFDNLLDALLDRFTANYNIIANTVLELVSISPNEVVIPRADGDDLVYRGAVLGIRLRIWEGRV